VNPAATVDLGAVGQWYGRGLDGRTIKMRSRIKDGVLILRPHMRDWREWVVWASGKANYYISKVLNQFWNAAAFSFPATLYFGLWTATLSASSTGSTAGETTYTGYARVAMTANTTNFPTSSAGAAIQNAVAVTFGQDTVGTPTITYVAVCDASTTGNLLFWGSITSITLAVNEVPQINVNGLTASEA
jgi:hypothetical protein